MEIQVSSQSAEKLAAQAADAGFESVEAYASRVLDEVAEAGPPATVAESNGANGDGGESAYDIAERLGVLGSFRSGKGDLSTNPAHLEGFGR